VPPNLRLSLTIFSLGFAVEGAGALYTILSHQTALPGGSTLLLLSPAFTVVGLLALFIGRHEWNEVHARRVRHAHLSFGVAVLLGALAAVPVVLFGVITPTSSPPALASLLFATALGGSFLFGYGTYVLVVFHLLGRVGQTVVVLALVSAAIVIGGLMVPSVAAHLGTYVSAVRSRVLSGSTLSTPITASLGWLFAAYFLFFAAFIAAHHRVARGLAKDPAASPAAPSS